MSRLDSFIRRLQAQKACLEFAVTQTKEIVGPVVELGLGNGRTFDHLRECLPDRRIVVFERSPNPHVASRPSPEDLVIGDLADTLPRARQILGQPAALLHSDIGCGDPEIDRRTATLIAAHLQVLVAPGGYVISDQHLEVENFAKVELPEGVADGRYTLLRRPTG